jgi:hypothetical protein
MNKYQLEIFEQIKDNQNVFLLNGPSIVDLEGKILKLRDKRILYWGFNNIEGIEKNILSKINKGVDIYFIESADELDKRIVDVVEFLNRDQSKLLIIGSNWVNRTEAFKANILPNFHKVILLEKFVKGSNNVINSCGSALLLFIRILSFKKTRTTLFLFGMDGVLSRDMVNSPTHSYSDTYSNKLPRSNAKIMHFGQLKSSLESIYDDMVNFDLKTTLYLQKIDKKVFNNTANSGLLLIYNANKNSCYKSLPKITQDEAIAMILKISKDGMIETPDISFTLDEQLVMHEEILDFVYYHWFKVDFHRLSFAIDELKTLYEKNLSIAAIKPTNQKNDSFVRRAKKAFYKKLNTKIKNLLYRLNAFRKRPKTHFGNQ